MNNEVFGKTMKNEKKYRDVKIVTTERRRNYLVLGLNYDSTKFFTKILLPIEMKIKKKNKQTDKQKSRDTYELTRLFRTFNNRIK